ncbi:MAG: branched-chain amino acid ABC transporter permease [Clostridiales bacterium]|jgi:branched-chain amino acid transport system permease protein|nr:branched-chain amino acid ABC transporter permease [Clostridiales bacterium]OPZ69501.1 MAG: leucine/isoleucine/valine transporter permease subunit [Firmicutes bacterium ADurb.Bin467]
MTHARKSRGPILTPGRIIPLILLLIMALIPALVTSNYLITILVNCMAFAIFGLSWNIIGGYGAQISWCSAAFVAIGAYVNFILTNEAGISPFLTLPLGMALSYAMATVIGYGTFRLRGAYFSIATIAFAETLRAAVQYFKPLTKGTAGIYLTYRGANFWHLTFPNDRPFYFIMLILLVLTLFFTYRFTVSKTGYYLSCIKGDEIAAESLGIETFKVKLRAFQVSAMMMSVAGCFYASFLTYISPASTCSFDLSIKIGVVAIIGGIGTLWGPVLGAFIIVPLIELAAKLLGASGSSNVLYGLMLVLIVIFRPKGVLPLLTALYDKVFPARDAAAKGGRRA